MNSIKAIFLIILISLIISPLSAQNLKENIHLFQSYFYDSPITKAIYVDAGLQFATQSYGPYDASTFEIGGKGGYPVNEKLEIRSGLSFVSVSADGADGQSGLSDLAVYGNYKLSQNKTTQFSAGGMLTLPIGSEDVGYSNLNFGGFGAVRHALDNGLVLTGTLGLIFYETVETDINWETGDYSEETKHESYLNIGFGTIYQMNQQLDLVGELTFRSEGDYMLLSGGGDYKMSNGRLRGALGLGLDDGAPDFLLMGSYQLRF